MKYTCVDEYEPWSGILADAVFVMLSTENRLKLYTPVKLIFWYGIILLIKHKVDCELICQKKTDGN